MPTSNLPLAGLKVLDFTHQVAGPFCTMLLADLGAEVIKVERFPDGDQARNWPMFGPSVYLALNRNKKSISIDLSNSKALPVVARLLKSSNVLVENFTPGALEKYELGFDDVQKISPRIVYCSIWGYRPDGPFGGYPAWDPVIQARSGLMMTTGEAEGPPMRLGASVVDETAGIFAASAILAALYKAEKEGTAERIIIPLFDCALSLMSFWLTRYSLTKENPPRMGSSYPAFVPYRAYATRDGYIFLAASNNEFWRSLCEALSRPDLIQDSRYRDPESRVKNREALDVELASEIKKWEREDLLGELERRDLPCSPVNQVSNIFEESYHASLLEMFARTNGNRQSFAVAPCPVIMESLKLPYRPPPSLGANTAELLKDAGFSESEIAHLAEQRVVGLVS